MHLRFNGAATLSLRKLMDSVDPPSKWVTLQWGRNFIVAEICKWRSAVTLTPTSFNGAATLSLWKFQQIGNRCWFCHELQRGRNFIVAEMVDSLMPSSTQHLASMGPQLYRCGNHAPRPAYPWYSWCFNGAATLSLRKFGCCWSGCIRPYQASMGPQLYRCGNAYLAHVFASPSKASMGPQLYRCGNRPCLQSHNAHKPRFNGAATLSLRKQAVSVPTQRNYVRLQWGRNFIVAETTSRRPEAPTGHKLASMGPQLYRCGNWDKSGEGYCYMCLLQWGRNFIVAETGVTTGGVVSRTVLQWGRNFIVAETK